MKKMIVILLVLILLTVTYSNVVAGGDKVRGGTGEGEGDQNTHEVGCEFQPCEEDAPRSQPGQDAP
jgi:hypothetical protein